MSAESLVLSIVAILIVIVLGLNFMARRGMK
jgi:hypothetical protein